MIAVALGLLGGILIALALPFDWQPGTMLGLTLPALLALITGSRSAALAMLTGFVLAHCAATRVLTAPLDCGERRLVVARIETIPVPQRAGWQYDAWVEPVSAPRRKPLRVRISHAGSAAPASGERWQLLLQFDTPAAGPAAGERRRALLRDHVSASARLRESPLNRRLQPAAASIDGLRLKVADRIQQRVLDASTAALLAALAVGVTGDVSALQWRVFSATGITHLVAISGMHVTFFALLCMALARASWRRCAWLAARCRREAFAAVVGVVLAFAYALLSGFSVPAQRTALMLSAFLVARGCGRHVAPLWSVAAALVAVLVFDPLAVLGAGLWLSFGAVVAIILLAGGRVQAPGSLRAAALVQWVVTVALLPLTAALFGSFSAVGPLVNAAAIPLFTFALVPPVLVATALYLVPLAAAQWGADHLVDLAAWVAQQSWPWLVRASELPGALWDAEAPVLWLLLAVPAVVLVLAPVPVTMRLGAALLLCAGFLPRPPRVAPGSLELVMFDVGASRAVLLRTAHHQLLLGTGEGFGTAGQRFERAVLPELARSSAALEMQLDRADRDSLKALAMASTRLHLAGAAVGNGRAPPGLAGCIDRQWQWDGVGFTRHATADGCWHGVRAGGRLVVVAPPRASTGVIDFADPASLQVLPRRADDAARVLASAAPAALALASVSNAAWESAGWRKVRATRDTGGPPLWSTATLGKLRLVLHADGRLQRPASGAWRAGVWATEASGCLAP